MTNRQHQQNPKHKHSKPQRELYLFFSHRIFQVLPLKWKCLSSCKLHERVNLVKFRGANIYSLAVMENKILVCPFSWLFGVLIFFLSKLLKLCAVVAFY